MKQPIFVFGSPRSGVTLLEAILGSHPELAWLSQYNNLLPKRPIVSVLSRLYELPAVGPTLYEIAWGRTILGKSVLPIPYESWNFWERNLPNFKKGVKAMASHPPNANDVSDVDAVRIQKALNACAHLQSKPRIFATYGDYPRIQYLTKAFPDALFIHLVRDGRAVCESYFRMNQKGLFNSWSERHLWFKHMPQTWYDSFRKNHYNVFGLSVYRWKYYLDLCRKESRQISSKRFMEIHYEDIVQYPIWATQRIVSFAGLQTSARMQRFVEKVPPVNCNTKWRDALTSDQLSHFFEIVTENENLDLLNDNL